MPKQEMWDRRVDGEEYKVLFIGSVPLEDVTSERLYLVRSDGVAFRRDGEDIDSAMIARYSAVL